MASSVGHRLGLMVEHRASEEISGSECWRTLGRRQPNQPPDKASIACASLDEVDPRGREMYVTSRPPRMNLDYAINNAILT